MKTMRILAKVFVGVGFGLDAFYVLLYLLIFKLTGLSDSGIPGVKAVIWVLVSYLIIGTVLAVLLYISLNREKKFIALGVLGIIFLSLAGGIFYLIWQPEDSPRVVVEPIKSNIEIGKSYEETFGKDYKNRVLEVNDKVIILDDANDVKPIVRKGDVFYVYKSDPIGKRWDKRYTKVVSVDKNKKLHKYNFHSYVFKKVGKISDDYPDGLY